MDSDERIAVTELQGCRLTPASWDKRFIRHLGEMRDVGITEKEVPQLWRIFIRYRRQIGHPEKNRLLDKAAKLSAPDLRKQAAAQREQARIDELKNKVKEARYVKADPQKRYWCNSHERIADYLIIRKGMPPEPHCAPRLSGILLPCNCVDITGIAEIIEDGHCL